MTEYAIGDLVVCKLHPNDTHKLALKVTRVTNGGKIQVLGKYGKRMSLRPHQIMLLRKASKS